MHHCRAITSWELDSDGETAHMVEVLQRKVRDALGKTAWKGKEHGFQSLQRDSCFAWNE